MSSMHDRSESPGNEFAGASDRVHEAREVLKGILPAMEADGGGLSVDKVEKGDVYVSFRGTCLDCPSISMTIQQGVEPTLQKLPWFRRLVLDGSHGPQGNVVEDSSPPRLNVLKG